MNKANTTAHRKICNVLVVSQYGDPAIGGAERYIQEVTSRLSTYPELNTKTLFTDLTNKDRCELIFVGTDSYINASPHLRKIKNRFVIAPPVVDPIMAEGKRSGDRSYILFVGKPDLPAKGFEFLKEAFMRLKKHWIIIML